MNGGRRNGQPVRSNVDNTTSNGESLSFFDLEKEGRVKVNLLPWQVAGKSYTASGYGSRTPTGYMVKVNKRWHRVYCICYSNAGTCYITEKGRRVVVTS